MYKIKINNVKIDGEYSKAALDALLTAHINGKIVTMAGAQIDMSNVAVVTWEIVEHTRSRGGVSVITPDIDDGDEVIIL